MKKKISIICLMVILMVATMMGGCVGSKSKGEIMIMVLTNSGSDLYYEKIFKEMEEDFGVEIDYAGYAFQDYDQRLRLQMQDRVPDIFYIRPNQIKAFIADDLLLDLNPYIEANVDISHLINGFNNAFTYDGKDLGVDAGNIYAVSGGFSYQGLAYNKSILDACADQIHAVGLKTPDELIAGEETYTWSEFFLLLNTIKGSPVGGAAGTTAISGMDIPTGTMMLQFLMNFGVNILNNDKIDINNDYTKAALNWILDARETGAVSTEFSFPHWKGNTLAFYTASGSWEMAPYGEVNESTSGQLNDANVNFMPWPTVTGKYEDSRALIGGAGYAVSKNTKNPEVAQKIVTHFMREEVLNEQCKLGFGLPMTKSLSEGEYLNDPLYHPENKQLLVDIISGKVGEYSPLNNCYSTEWYDEFNRNIDSLWIGNKTVNEYLVNIENVMQEKYNFYNK